MVRLVANFPSNPKAPWFWAETRRGQHGHYTSPARRNSRTPPRCLSTPVAEPVSSRTRIPTQSTSSADTKIPRPAASPVLTISLRCYCTLTGRFAASWPCTKRRRRRRIVHSSVPSAAHVVKDAAAWVFSPFSAWDTTSPIFSLGGKCLPWHERCWLVFGRLACGFRLFPAHVPRVVS